MPAASPSSNASPLLYRSNEQYPQAADAFRQMAELEPDLAARAAAQIVDTYRQARDFARASEEADAASKKYPTDRMVVVYRALLLADLDKGKEAVAEARKLFSGDEDREAWLTLAQVSERAKDFDEMGKALDAVEKLSDDRQRKGDRLLHARGHARAQEGLRRRRSRVPQGPGLGSGQRRRA